MSENEYDIVNKARHYNVHPVFSKECIEYVKDMNFCSGNAFKYLFRHLDKDKPSEDIRKAIYYINMIGSKVNFSYDQEISESLKKDFFKWEKENSPVLKGGLDYYELIVYKTIVNLYSEPDISIVKKHIPELEKYAEILDKQIDRK